MAPRTLRPSSGGTALASACWLRRPGGGHDAQLCRTALGVDLNGLALAAALGESVPEESLIQREGAGWALIALVPPVGTLDSVEGIQAAEAMEGIVWVRVDLEAR